MPSERVQRRIDALLDEADAAIASRDLEAAAQSVRMVLRIEPENEDALTFSAMLEGEVRDGISAETDDVGKAELSDTPDSPTSFANGRYEVTGFLGEGGKKKVYLAHDTTLDRDVAFALIKTEGLDDASRQRVTREAQAMGRLGDNPNIMPIFDLGDENGQPYMVQPLMGGGDVEALIEDAEDGRLSLEDALRIASEICHGLEFAHSKSIIHRDLKPGNVWLTDDGTARIGDFGLAISLDRSRLTQEKMMIGTVSYMPPEQATGGEITPKADLYSLGAMLYEMVTGRPPFMGDDEIAIIGQHINTPPVAPQWHRPEIPATLDSLIMRLLSKNPAERPDSAADVLSALQAIDVSEQPDPEALEGPDASGSLDSMASGVFVGRHREMDQLKALLENALSGRGGMVTLVGEPGIGKSRTSQELETYAGLRNAQVLWGRCYEGTGAPPYWPWVQAIRSYVSSREPDELRKVMGSTASVIAEIVEDVRERLPETQAPSQMEDPDSARFRLFDSIATFLKNAALARPIVLILDDLHWADKPSLMLLEFIARELSGSRILLIGTYRDMELNRRHPLSVTLGDLTRERLFERVLLRGLTREDVARFIEIAAGVAPPRGLVDAVQTQTEGNPLFVTETVRLLIQEGDLTQDLKNRSDSSWNIRIPEGVREVIGRRLDRLSERCNEVLATASVIGRRFTLDQLRAIVEEITEDRLLDVIDEGLSARVIEELPEAVGNYQFSHAVVQETLAGEMSATRTVRMHARIAEALEKLYGDKADDHAEELVTHFAEAETVLGTDRLIRYAIVAGRRSLEAVAPDSAENYFQTGIDAFGDGKPDARLAEMLGGLGQAQVSTLERIELQNAVDNLTRSFDLYMELDQPAAAVGVASTSMPSVHGPTGMADLLERALPLTQEGGREQGRLLSEFGLWVSHERADYKPACDAFNRALAIAIRQGYRALELRVHDHAVSVHSWNLEYEDAFKSAEAAIRLADELDDPSSAVSANFFLGQYYLSNGDLASARRHADACTDLAGRSKNLFHWTSAMFVNAVIAAATGDWEAERTFLDRGLSSSPTETRLLNPLISLEFSLGNFDRGLELLERETATARGPGGMSGGNVRNVGVAAFGAIQGAAVELTPEIEQSAREAFANEALEPLLRFSALRGLAMIAVARRDRALAAEVYENQIFSEQRRRGAAGAGWLFGTVAWIAGDVVAASTHFEDAIAFDRNAGFKPSLAETCAYYAEMLLDRDAPGDREKATQLQDDAIAIAQELGMTPLLERVLAQREMLKA